MGSWESNLALGLPAFLHRAILPDLPLLRSVRHSGQLPLPTGFSMSFKLGAAYCPLATGWLLLLGGDSYPLLQQKQKHLQRGQRYPCLGPVGLKIFFAMTWVCPCNTKAALDNTSPTSVALLQEVFVYQSKRVTWPSGSAWLAPAAHGAFAHHFHVNCYLVASPNTTYTLPIFCEFFFFTYFRLPHHNGRFTRAGTMLTGLLLPEHTEQSLTCGRCSINRGWVRKTSLGHLTWLSVVFAFCPFFMCVCVCGGVFFCFVNFCFLPYVGFLLCSCTV